jgi:hypothetical protein
MSKVFNKVLINELKRILKRSIKRKVDPINNNNEYINKTINSIVNFQPYCLLCKDILIKLYNCTEYIYEIREDWCIDYDKTYYTLNRLGPINGLICRTCNMQKAWNAMEICDSPDNQPEPMDVD